MHPLQDNFHWGDTMTIHDRRSTDTLKAGQYAPIEIQDPYDPESKLVVLRQLRGDPLGRLHAHRQIDEAQYHAGRAYQRDWELAERGARAIDPSKEAVDGGLLPEPLTDSQVAARKRLVQVRAVMGRKAAYVVDLVVICGQSITAIVPVERQIYRRQFAHLLRNGLDELAIEYGLAGKPKHRVAVQQIT